MFSLFFIGPGGIRTHDQRIMSPLRYRCATGPWRVFIKFSIRFGLSVSGETSFPALPSSPRTILNRSRRQSAKGHKTLFGCQPLHSNN